MTDVPFASSIAAARRWIASESASATARWALPAIVFLVALAVRWWFVDQHPLDLYLVSNMEFIEASARHLVAGSPTVTDSFTPVGYPSMVATAYTLAERGWGGTGYQLVGRSQAVLGSATSVLGYALTRRLTGSVPVAFVVGLALAFYLPLIVYAGFLLTETVFAFLIAVFAWLFVRALEARAAEPRALDPHATARAALAGTALGVAIAVRPNLILVAPILLIVAIAKHRTRPHTLKVTVLALVFTLPILGPIVVHNSRLVGRPAGLATNGGVNFLLGHCECRGISFRPGFGVGFVSGHQNRLRYTEVIASPRPALDESYYYWRTLVLVRERPSLVLRAVINVTDGLTLTGLGEPPEHPYYPGWMGHEDELRAFGRAFAWLCIVPVLIHATARALRRTAKTPARSPNDEPTRGVLLALFASAIATLYLFLGDPRLRVPFDPILFALAADAWRRLARVLLSAARTGDWKTSAS